MPDYQCWNCADSGWLGGFQEIRRPCDCHFSFRDRYNQCPDETRNILCTRDRERYDDVFKHWMSNPKDWSHPIYLGECPHGRK